MRITMKAMKAKNEFGYLHGALRKLVVITQQRFLPRGKSPPCQSCCQFRYRRYSPNRQIHQHHGRATEVGREGANVAH